MRLMNGGFVREDAVIKCKFAAELYPFRLHDG